MLTLTALICTGASWTLGPFTRTGILNPVLGPNPKIVFKCPMQSKPVQWEHDHVFNPAATEFRGSVVLLYRAEDNSGSGIGGHTSRIGFADSNDGIHFAKRPQPVLFPAKDTVKRFEWTGGCEDPRVVKRSDGLYVVTYTSWDRKTARLCVATSRDLTHWTKHGPVFAGTSFADQWSKSGSIVTKLNHEKLEAVKINGLFWMYWGEGSIKIASSLDLIHWKPILTSPTEPLGALTPRANHFDSELVEPGPPAVLTKDGIILIYNGKNAQSGGDTTIDPGAYAAGQALFDRTNPTKLIDRTDSYFFKPELPCERTGQYKAGTVFTEGLVRFNRRWYLYYGAADSFVGLAVAK